MTGGRDLLVSMVAAVTAVLLAPVSPAAAAPSWQPVFEMPASGSAGMNDVTTTAPGDVWSVGTVQTPAQLETATVWHTVGGVTTVSYPDLYPTADQVVPRSVAAFADDDVWFVGVARFDGQDRPLAARFDGTTWSSVPLPLPPDLDYGQLSAIEGRSGTDLWITGSWSEPGALLLHWDGISLQRVRVPALVPECRGSRTAGVGALALSRDRLYVEAFCDVGTLVLARAATGGWSVVLTIPDLASIYGMDADETGGVAVLTVDRISSEATVYRGTGPLQRYASYLSTGQPHDFWGIAADPTQVYVVGHVNNSNTPLAAAVTRAGFAFETVVQPSGRQPLWEVTIDDAGTAWAVTGPGNQGVRAHPFLLRRAP